MKLSDLCMVKDAQQDLKPLVCYGEVKTISASYNKKIAIEGHDSLILGEAKDFLSEPEILQFYAKILYETQKLEEATFISEIALGKIQYDKRHDLFIIHTKEKWKDQILDLLDNHPLDERLIDFSTKIVLISQLKDLIAYAYDRCTTVTKALINSMDKQMYLDNTYLSLESLMGNRQFKNDLAQVQARSIQEELLSIQPNIHYTFKPKEMWQRCSYIFSNSSLLLQEETQVQTDTEKRQTLFTFLKTAAQTFEFLSKFAQEDDVEILLINSAICWIWHTLSEARLLFSATDRSTGRERFLWKDPDEDGSEASPCSPRRSRNHCN